MGERPYNNQWRLYGFIMSLIMRTFLDYNQLLFDKSFHLLKFLRRKVNITAKGMDIVAKMCLLRILRLVEATSENHSVIL
jgi:hypothetical protein